MSCIQKNVTMVLLSLAIQCKKSTVLLVPVLFCRQDEEGYEDVEMGICMQNLNVTAGDSRDEYGRGRFFAVVPEHMIVPDLVPEGFWIFGYSYYPVETVWNHL